MRKISFVKAESVFLVMRNSDSVFIILLRIFQNKYFWKILRRIINSLIVLTAVQDLLLLTIYKEDNNENRINSGRCSQNFRGSF